MGRIRIATILLSACLAATSAKADTEFSVGQFVMQTQRWDVDGNRFLPGAADGEGEGCWQITEVGIDALEMTLVSGHFKPWWTDQVVPLGSDDTWFDSDAFREANPNAAPLTMTRQIFSEGQSC